MRGYNIYYKNCKLNSRVLSKEDVINIQKKQYIVRNNADRIPSAKIRIIPTIIV